MAINKLTANVSTGTNLVDTVNGLIDSVPQTTPAQRELQIRFSEGMNSPTSYNYIVSGDSTRDAPNGRGVYYYNELLPKINFSVSDNSAAGQSAEDWANNTDSTTVDQAIAFTDGTGASTILEFSLGLNDYTDGSPSNAATIKASILLGLNTYIAAKPDAIVFLVSPVATARANIYETIYEEIANELGLFWASGYSATIDVHGDDRYYVYDDNTHPNYYGSMRLVNYIFDNALPEYVKPSMWITDAPALGQIIPSLTVKTGYWDEVGGDVVIVDNSSWRRTELVKIDPSSMIDISHSGNQSGCFLFDINKEFIKSLDSKTLLEMRYTAHYVAFNISDDGTTWDALNETPVAFYNKSYNYPQYITQEVINEGLSMGLPYRKTDLVDDDGFTGSVGEVYSSGTLGDKKWSSPSSYITKLASGDSPDFALDAEITLTGDFDIEMQYSLTSVSGDRNLLRGSGGDFFRLNAGTDQFTYRIDSVFYTANPHAENLELNTVRFRRVGTTVDIIWNGDIVDSKTIAVADWTIAGFGSRASNDYFNGYLRNIKVIDKVNTIANFKLDEDFTVEAVAKNSVDRLNNATMTNATDSKLFSMAGDLLVSGDGTKINLPTM